MDEREAIARLQKARSMSLIWLAVEKPPAQRDHADHDQQEHHRHRAADSRAPTATTETDHALRIFAPPSGFGKRFQPGWRSSSCFAYAVWRSIHNGRTHR